MLKREIRKEKTKINRTIESPYREKKKARDENHS
jgi:hypothetical protein